MDSVVSKKEFADLARVTQGRVSQWLAGRKIYGDAIVGRGHRARIKVPVALEQLKKTLDVDQRLSGNARARLDGSRVADDVIEDKIKSARLAQIELSNSKARIEAAARSGRYILAEDARQEMGRLAGRMMSVFEASLSEFANAMIAKPPGSPRDALLVLRSTWREVRARQAGGLAAEAAGMPSTVEDGDASQS